MKAIYISHETHKKLKILAARKEISMMRYVDGLIIKAWENL